MNKEEHLDYLLQQYYDHNITDQELVALKTILEAADEKVMSERLHQFMIPRLRDYEATIDYEMLEKDIQQIVRIDRDDHSNVSAENKILKIHKYRRRIAIAVAASLLFLIGFYVVMSKREHQEEFLTAEHTDLQPGKEGALLTLSDGTEVVLDSLGNSAMIENTDGVSIQIINGQVIYKNANGQKVEQVVRNTMSTPKGRQYQLTLSDGTKVWLNAASSITYPVTFEEDERIVSVSGEVYFEVNSLPSKRPFIVHVNNSETSIKVLGTHFNINAYGDENNIKTTLLEGKVMVNHAHVSQKLSPGQQAVTNTSNDLIQVRNDIDISQVAAWRNHLFVFSNMDIANIMKELGRWYDFEATYIGTPPAYKFSGKIDKGLSLKQVLNLIGATNITYKINSDKQITIFN